MCLVLSSAIDLADYMKIDRPILHTSWHNSFVRAEIKLALITLA